METREIKIELLKLEIKAREKALTLIESIIETAKKFDGKVINKRFDTALKKIDDNLRFHTTYNSFIIEMYIDNRDYCTDGHAYYLKQSSLSIVHISIESIDGDGVCQEGTLRSDILIEWIERYKESFIKEIAGIKQGIKNLDKIIDRRAKIIAEIEEFNRTTNYMIRQYFDLTIKR